MCDINCIWLFNLLAAVVLIILQQQQHHYVVAIEQHQQQHPHQKSPYNDISSYAAVSAAKYLHRSTLPQHNVVKRDTKNVKSTDFISYLNDFNIQDEASIPEDIIDQQHLQEIIDKQQQGLRKKADSIGNSASNDDGDFIDVNLPYDDSEAEVDIILESQRSSERSDDNKTNNNNQNSGNNNQIEVVLVEDEDKVVKDKDKINLRKTNKKNEKLEEKKTLKANNNKDNKSNNKGNIDNKNKEEKQQQQQQKRKIKSENNIDYSNQYMYDVEEQDLEDANNDDDDKFQKYGLDDDDEADDDDGSAEYEKFKTMHEQKQQQQQQQKEHMSFLQKRLNERKFNNNNNNPDLNEKNVNINNKNNHDNDNGGGDNLDNGNDDSYDNNNNNKNDDYEKFHKYQQEQQQQQQPKEDAIGDIEETENQSMAKSTNTIKNNNDDNDNKHGSKDLTPIFIPRKMKRHNGAARLDDVTNRHTRLRQEQQQQQELMQQHQKSQIDTDEEENPQKENVAKISSQEENFKKKYYDILKENSTQDHNHHRPSTDGEMLTGPKDFSYYDENYEREPTYVVPKQTAFEKEKMLRRNNKHYGHKTHKKKYKDYLRYSQIMMMTSTTTTPTTSTEQTPSKNFEATKKGQDATTKDKLIDRNGDLNALRDKHLAKLKLEKLKSLIPQAPIFFLKPKTEEKVVKKEEEEPKLEEPTAKPFYEGQINYFMETDDDDSERANAVRFITKGERVDTNDWYKKLSPVLRNGLKKSTSAPEEKHGFAAVRAGYTPYHHYKHSEQSQSPSLHQQPRNHQYHHQHQQHHHQHQHHQPHHHRQVGKHSRHHAYQRKMMPRKFVTTTTPMPPPSRQHLESGDAIRQLGHQITDIKDFERYYAKWPHLAKVQSQLHEEQLREEQAENYPDYEYDNDDYWEENVNKDDNLPPYIRKYNRRNKQLLDLLEGTIAPPTKPVQQLRWSGSKLQPGPRDTSSVGSMSVRIDDDYLKEKRKRYHQRQRQIHDLFAQQRQPTTTSTQATATPPTYPPSAVIRANSKEDEDGYLKASSNSHTENHFPDEDVSISLETNEHDNDYNNPKQHGINNDGHGNNDNDDVDDDDNSKSTNEQQQHEEIWQKEIDTKSANTGNSQLTWQMEKLMTSTLATPPGAPLSAASQKAAIFKLPSYPSIAGSFMNRPRSRSAQFAPSSGSEFRRVTLPYLNSNLENNHQNNMNNNFINAGGFVAYNGAATNSKAITARFSQNLPNEYKQQQQQQQQQQLQESPAVLQLQTTTGVPVASSAEKSLYNRNNQHLTPPSSSVTNSFVYHRVVDASPRLVGAGILAGGGRKQRLPFVAITDRRLETSKKSLTDHQKDFEQNHYPLP